MAKDIGRFESLFSAPQERPGHASDREGPPRNAPEAPPPEKESYQELERKYRHRTYQAQELMVEKLLRGQFSDTRALERKLHMFDLDFQYDCYMLVLVSPGGNTTFSEYASDIRDGGQVGLIVSSIFSELLSEQYSCYPANLEDRYAFLLNFAPEKQDGASADVAAVCRYGVRFIQDNFNLDLQICVSAVCDSIQSLHEAFLETEVVASDSQTRYTEGVCVRAESELPDAEHRPEPTVEKQYLNALVVQDFQLAQQLTLDRCRAIYEESGGELERVKRLLNLRMQTTSSVIAMPLGQLVDEQEPGMDRGRWMERCETLEEIEQLVQTIFRRLDSHFNTIPSDYSGTTGRVIQLINQKYMEPDLSVEMICDSLGKSRSYLSRMFKENTGMNLLDYLHTTRLNEAKKLLNDTDLGISEIASRVGYYSGWTLARVFKRYEGITPTAYRKAFCMVPER